MLPVQLGEVNQIARVAEYVHSSLSDNESGGEERGGGGPRRHGRCLARSSRERSLGPMCLREEFVESLGSLVEMCASNKTDGFRDGYSRTIRW